MIEKITISDIATYPSTPTVLDDFSKFNYFFGSNGSGKTTISRIIADPRYSARSSIAWKRGTKLRTLVYNRDFTDRNFNASTNLKGVFTLGEEQVDALKKIELARAERARLQDKSTGLSKTLAEQDQMLADEKGKLMDRAWIIKQEWAAEFQSAF
ncbi:MAG: AAA family ATPase [Acidobacteria bacterium]|nr:AAA family ATPase [Acidobacteriota bacterium]